METVYPAGHQAATNPANAAKKPHGKDKIVNTEIKYKIAKAILADGGTISRPREYAKNLGLHATSMHYVLKIWGKHLVSHVSRDDSGKARYEFSPAFLEQAGAEVSAWEGRG